VSYYGRVCVTAVHYILHCSSAVLVVGEQVPQLRAAGREGPVRIMDDVGDVVDEARACRRRQECYCVLN